MTCIVGVKHEGNVYIGSDSAGVNGALDICVVDGGKVFAANNMIFGYSGSFRVGQILEHSFAPQPQAVGQDDYEYLCSTWIDSLMECLRNKGASAMKDGNLEVMSEATLLIGFNGELYEVHENFQVLKLARPYSACGCGASYALGALSLLGDETPPNERIAIALGTAEEFSAGVRGPFVIQTLTDEVDFTLD